MSGQIPLQRTIDQKRAQQAWNDVKEARDQGVGNYKSLVRGMPADIQISGFGQAMAFIRAKGKSEHLMLFEHIQGWLIQQMNLPAKTNLMEWISTKATTEEYRRATVEAMAFLMWLKRFAEAEIK